MPHLMSSPKFIQVWDCVALALVSLGFLCRCIYLNLTIVCQRYFSFYLFFFSFRIPLSFIDGWVVGKIGPKHGIAISTLLFVVFLSALLTLELIGWPLWFLALLFTITNGLFFISYHTDFSKIKDTKHSGKGAWLAVYIRTVR